MPDDSGSRHALQTEETVLLAQAEPGSGAAAIPESHKEVEMPRMLVASSPVEIEAKAEAAELPREAHDVARRMFHDLTDRLGQAAIALAVPHEDWPNHRFYFGTPGGEMSALLEGLQARPDLLDVTDGVPARQASLSGIYIQARQDSFIGVLVGHQNHAGWRSPA
jgi:hypothetical protein